MTLMTEVVTYAADRNLGIYETLGVVLVDEPASVPIGGSLIAYDRKRVDPELRKRIELAARPPKTPGRLARLLGKGQQSPLDDQPSQNGHVKFDE
jgi:hypothetical protein